MTRRASRCSTWLLCATVLAAGTAVASNPAPGSIDTARLLAANAEPQNLLTGGRDAGGSYYSSLSALNAFNVARLGLPWQYDLGAPLRAQEATPVVVDGVMYTSGTWGYVYALDAATGHELWRYD